MKNYIWHIKTSTQSLACSQCSGVWNLKLKLPKTSVPIKYTTTAPPPPPLSPTLPKTVQLYIVVQCRNIHLVHCYASRLVRDLQITIYSFEDFGKEFIKHCRLSPDAFIQVALQLAYYRYAPAG